jgi:sulfide dehydrogenase [flavocytochrome c] flavoprotein chain
MNAREHPMSITRLNRRQWLTGAAAGAASLSLAGLGWSPRLQAAGLSARVVVIGAGMAGATAAKYLRLWGGSGVTVTLVEPDAAYTSNIMSNLVLSGGRTLASLQQDTSALVSRHGVTRRTAQVTRIDPVARRVSLSDGSSLDYDRLVVAPGVAFMPAYGLSLADYDLRTPHAWRAGAQTQLLREQLLAMPADGTVVMSIPKAPYRCPPGPYERACLMADFLKTQKGSGARVLVLDENSSIQAERETFTRAFNEVHAGVIEYHPDTAELQIDPLSRVVRWTDLSGTPHTVQAQVVNPIAPHRASGSAPGGWLAEAGLANSADGRWAVVNVQSYESTAVPGVHVIGDAAQCGLPKAGHVANQEAKICADAILRLLAGGSPYAAPVANSACYSPITASTASWLTAVYQYDPSTRSMKPAADNGSLATGRAIESASISSRNFDQMGTWFRTLMSDSFT